MAGETWRVCVGDELEVTVTVENGTPWEAGWSAVAQTALPELAHVAPAETTVRVLTAPHTGHTARAQIDARSGRLLLTGVTAFATEVPQAS